MRIWILVPLFFSVLISSAQTKVISSNYGELEFIELDHGLASVEEGVVQKMEKSPSGTHGWLKDFVITKVTDSIPVMPKSNFGIVYMVKAKDTVDIPVDIEWVFPKTIKNNKKEKYKTFRYTTKRPTNIPSGSSYSLDEPFEMVKGNWVMNLYLENKLVYTRTFILY